MMIIASEEKNRRRDQKTKLKNKQQENRIRDQKKSLDLYDRQHVQMQKDRRKERRDLQT